jgi:hypothetical protein
LIIHGVAGSSSDLAVVIFTSIFDLGGIQLTGLG